MRTLRGVTWDHPRGYVGLTAASMEYATSHGVSIHWDRRSLQAFADQPIDELAETYDLIVLDHPHVGLIAEQGALVPLEPPSDAQRMSLGGSLESYIWQNSLWALPIDAACQMAVYREDLNTHSTFHWEDFLTADHAGPRPLTPLLPVDAFCTMMTLVASRGETKLPYSDSHFTSQANGSVALGVLKALYKLGPAEAAEWNPINVLEILSSENEFAYSPCLFGYINYARPGFRKQTLTYVDLPSFRTDWPPRGILGGAGIGVSSSSTNQAVAEAFAQWVASEPIQSGVYLNNEGQPAHRTTWDFNGADPRFSGFLKGGHSAMEQAWTRPRDPWFLGFVDDVCELFPGFFVKDEPIQKTLDQINTLYRHHRATGQKKA